MKTNLLLIPFNRPHYLKQVLKGLKASDFKNVYAFIDGARNAEDQKGINQVIKILKTHGITNINAQKKNLGINPAFETAITWFFSQVDAGVILEEDCIPDKSFFDFAALMLEKYRDDTRVGMICGTNLEPTNEDSYLFSHQFGIWGWGTWKDRWQKYTKIKTSKDIKINFYQLIKFTGSFAGALTLITKFKRLTSKNMGFWDMNWVFTNVINNWLCIIPQKNLIKNIGHFGNSSFKKTRFHDKETNKIMINKLENLNLPVKADLAYDRKIDYSYNFFPAIKSFLYQLLNFKKFF